MPDYRIIHGDSLVELKNFQDDSIDSVVTDPPYGISFMNKHWDYEVPTVDLWREVYRVLKPGGHILVACGTRTQHRMTVNIEDAGFEIRDVIAWVYGSGFPKSLDISKAIDKAAGAEREVVGKYQPPGMDKPWNLQQANNDRSVDVFSSDRNNLDITAPATDEAKQWEGWGTALKPAMELWTLARKPLGEKTVAANVLKHGTGGLNIDGCRVGDEGGCKIEPGTGGIDVGTVNALGGHLNSVRSPQVEGLGRFPANLIHDGSDEVVGLFPNSKGGSSVSGNEPSKTGDANCYGEYNRVPFESYNDSGSAARFFYCAKASKADRNEGLDRQDEHIHSDRKNLNGSGAHNPRNRSATPKKNFHPTVKPTALMRYLVRLITPPGGTVLDLFAGSGSTGKGAILEGFNVILIERDGQYIPINQGRCAYAMAEYEESKKQVDTQIKMV